MIFLKKEGEEKKREEGGGGPRETERDSFGSEREKRIRNQKKRGGSGLIRKAV